jgi:GNAT superfamily N-acetyltransferase
MPIFMRSPYDTAPRAEPNVADPEILAIERVAFEAWPAAEVRALGGWRLRFNHGVTNRGSSVWPGPGPCETPLEERFAEVERFYAERSAAACYQVSPAADPPALDARLAARGYEAFSPVSVEVAAVGEVLARATPLEVDAACSDTLPEEWFDVSGRRGRFREDAVAVYRTLLERLHGRAGFALARAGGQVAAVGLAVAAPPWVGVFSMLTLESYRRQRLAEAVLAAIARWALERGAERMYLQVEVENQPARSLYARVGFRPRYEYHYRREPR